MNDRMVVHLPAAEALGDCGQSHDANTVCSVAHGDNDCVT